MHIKIKGEKYKVVFKSLPNDHGEVDTEKKIIYIDNEPKTTGEVACNAMAHEICHGYLAEAYITTRLSDDLEEMICEAVGELVEKHIELLMDIKYGKS